LKRGVAAFGMTGSSADARLTDNPTAKSASNGLMVILRVRFGCCDHIHDGSRCLA
jgi:hypothetical protein